jgi:hypothetical protein
MFLRPLTLAVAAAFPLSTVPLSAFAQADTTAELRLQLQQLREQYEARLKLLEQRLDAAEKAQAAAASAPPSPPPSLSTSPSPAPAPAAAATRAAAPSAAPGLAVSAVLGGTYAHLRNDPESYRIQGFIPGGEEIGPGSRSFNLGESEITLSASVDPYFAGRLTFALTSEGEAEVEEAVVRTTALSGGVTLGAGRFLSAIGYLNPQHGHTWDFVDAPLAYQAFFGGQHRTDGLQLKWVAPLDTYVELTAEAGRGNAFPASERNRNGFGSVSLGARVGADWGADASWRAGVSLLHSKADDRRYDDVDSSGADVVNAYTGRTNTAVLDGVFKWAPAGRRDTGFKLQGEYVWQRESGSLAYDVDGASVGPLEDAYRSRASGGYVLGVYQLSSRWRVGLRHDRLRSGTPAIGLVASGALSAADFPRLERFEPRRTSAMVDYSLTEFSRLRLQVAEDRAQPGPADRQLFLQYVMSIGAHAAHGY